MRKIKSRFSSAIAMFLVLALFMSFNVNAKDIQKEATYDEKIEFLKSIGTTEEALSNYNPYQVDSLYNDLYGKDVHFSGSESKIVDISNGNPNSRGNISTSQLKLTVGTYDMITNGKVTAVNVSLGYQWLKEPILVLTDALTFTWDNNDFYDAGFYATSVCTVDGEEHVIEDINAPATAQAGGLGWYSKLSLPHHGNIYKHYGGAEVLLIPRTPFSSSANLDSKMYLSYAHQLVGVGISLGFPGSVGVTFTGGNYDQQSHSYTYH